MINWCAYCRTWQGEVPPLDSFEMTPGICSSCVQRGVAENFEAIRAITPVADFFRALRAEARSGFSTPGAVVLAQATGLGIQPLELLRGLLRPALDEIGKLWACGEVTVAAEHRFSSMVNSVVTLVLERAREASAAQQWPPEFLLVNAEGNHHTLGLRVVEAFLLSHGRTALTLVPGLPTFEVIALVRALQPKTLGVSVAMPGELECVKEIATALEQLPPERRPILAVGGQAIRAGAQLEHALGVAVSSERRALLAPQRDLDAPALRTAP